VSKTIAVLIGLWMLALPAAFGSPVLFDLALNNNGTFTDGLDLSSLPGGLSGDVGFDSTGLGTLTYTNAPGSAGTYFMAMYFDYDVAVPFWNEYGTVGGSASAGQTWQIDAAVVANDANFPAPTVFGNVQANTLDNTNHIMGQTDNSFFDCGANGGGAIDTTCNADVAFGMGFTYTLTSAQQYALVTFTTSTSPCSVPDDGGSGVCLGDIHPADAFNDGSQAVYLSATLSIQSLGRSVPEPASWLLVGSAALVGLGALRRKLGHR
jgi:PEP-CTERM motif